MASFYVALFPIGGNPTGGAESFFNQYLALPLIVFLYLIWKVYSWFKIPAHRPMFVRAKDIDIYTGMREDQRNLSVIEIEQERDAKKSIGGRAMTVVRSLF